MSQANSVHSTTLSRRAAMASSLAAFSLLPGTAMAANLAGHPDAELLALGREFAGMLRHRFDLRAELDALEATCTFPELPGKDATPEEGRAWWEAYCRSREQQGVEAVADRFSDHLADMDKLVEQRIWKVPATTLEGHAVKALTATYQSYLWSEKNKDAQDWDQYCLRRFIASILTYLPEDMLVPLLPSIEGDDYAA
jgi:hypothetical protein